MILRTDTIDRDVTLTADVCVVGSGAGGSVVAKEVAASGHSVVVVEEGSYCTNRDFTQREDEMYPRLYQRQGARMSVDGTALVLGGRAVGGSTLTSYCVCARPPRAILDHWQTRLGIPGVGAEEMADYYQGVEDTLQIQELSADQVNKNNRVVEVGAARLGLHSVRVAHNRVDCLGCGYCALGCAYDRKRDALTTYLRSASQLGAIIIPDCRADEVVTAGGRAAGVKGTFRTGRDVPPKLEVRAKAVVLAAGAVGSPQLWLRSKLPNASRQVGRNLHLHPQVLLAAVFNEPIEGWRGIPQSIVVDEFLGSSEGADGGFLLAPTFGHPVALASMLPGLGDAHRNLIELYSRLSVAAVIVRDRSSGSVEVDEKGRAMVGYHLNDDDSLDLIDGMRRLADIYFAAGAERVVLPFNELVELTRRGDYRALDERTIRPNDPLLISFHPQGSLRMGVDIRKSVVSPSGQAHQVGGLFVADASVFPTAIAVPPQLSVMAFAARTAQQVIGYVGG